MQDKTAFRVVSTAVSSTEDDQCFVAPCEQPANFDLRTRPGTNMRLPTVQCSCHAFNAFNVHSMDNNPLQPQLESAAQWVSDSAVEPHAPTIMYAILLATLSRQPARCFDSTQRKSM